MLWISGCVRTNQVSEPLFDAYAKCLQQMTINSTTSNPLEHTGIPCASSVSLTFAACKTPCHPVPVSYLVVLGLLKYVKSARKLATVATCGYTSKMLHNRLQSVEDDYKHISDHRCLLKRRSHCSCSPSRWSEPRLRA